MSKKVLRAFQIINDGNYSVNSTYSETDEAGNLTKKNARDSFYAVDPELQAHIDAIRNYIMENRLAGE